MLLDRSMNRTGAWNQTDTGNQSTSGNQTYVTSPGRSGNNRTDSWNQTTTIGWNQNDTDTIWNQIITIGNHNASNWNQTGNGNGTKTSGSSSSSTVDITIWVPYLSIVCLVAVLSGLAFSFYAHMARVKRRRDNTRDYMEKEIDLNRKRLFGMMRTQVSKQNDSALSFDSDHGGAGLSRKLWTQYPNAYSFDEDYFQDDIALPQLSKSYCPCQGLRYSLDNSDYFQTGVKGGNGKTCHINGDISRKAKNRSVCCHCSRGGNCYNYCCSCCHVHQSINTTNRPSLCRNECAPPHPPPPHPLPHRHSHSHHQLHSHHYHHDPCCHHFDSTRKGSAKRSKYLGRQEENTIINTTGTSDNRFNHDSVRCEEGLNKEEFRHKHFHDNHQREVPHNGYDVTHSSRTKHDIVTSSPQPHRYESSGLRTPGHKDNSSIRYQNRSQFEQPEALLTDIESPTSHRLSGRDVMKSPGKSPRNARDFVYNSDNDDVVKTRPSFVWSHTKDDSVLVTRSGSNASLHTRRCRSETRLSDNPNDHQNDEIITRRRNETAMFTNYENLQRAVPKPRDMDWNDNYYSKHGHQQNPSLTNEESMERSINYPYHENDHFRSFALGDRYHNNIKNLDQANLRNQSRYSQTVVEINNHDIYEQHREPRPQQQQQPPHNNVIINNNNNNNKLGFFNSSPKPRTSQSPLRGEVNPNFSHEPSDPIPLVNSHASGDSLELPYRIPASHKPLLLTNSTSCESKVEMEIMSEKRQKFASKKKTKKKLSFLKNKKRPVFADSDENSRQVCNNDIPAGRLEGGSVFFTSSSKDDSSFDIVWSSEASYTADVPLRFVKKSADGRLARNETKAYIDYEVETDVV